MIELRDLAPEREVSGAPAPTLMEDVRRIQDLFDQAPGMMAVTSGPDHVIAMANPAFKAFSGRAGLVGQRAADALSNMVSPHLKRLMDHVYATGRPLVQKATRVLVARPGGDEEAYVDFVMQPIREANGSVSGIFYQGHDVTAEKLAADELAASREQLRAALEAAEAIFDNSHDIICAIDDQGRFARVNRHAERMWGYRPDELVGRHFLEFVHVDDRAATAEIADQMRGGHPVNGFMNRYVHRDGFEVPVTWSAIWSETHRCLFGIGRDMRAFMAAEEKLRQAQKMEAIGRLTGGVAHDFNNLLTVVIGSAEGLAEVIADRPDALALARVALEAAERGAELVSQLLAVSRTQPLAPQPVDCGQFLAALLPILQRTLGGEIEVEVAVGQGDLCCMADLTQLTSAMLNLCINARDAMPDGGRLTLGAVRAPSGEAVVLSVTDTGEGMSAQTRAQALEPFFTTKPDGKGSGLGLSMVYGFAAQSGGRLEIDSAPGEGTCVRLSLPWTPLCQQASRAPARLAVPPGGRRVLLVEDDDLVRGQVQRHLLALGCEVTACANGYDALDVLAAGEGIDLLMTDIRMPGGLNGRQLADHARLLDPGLSVLFTSGHTDDPIVRSVIHDRRAGFIAKPYRRAELGAKLAELALG